MRLDTVIGYTYKADTYCPTCTIARLPTGPGEEFDGWAIAAGAYVTPEDNLTELAAAFGIDRFDERTFDSGDFPKVIFADQFEGDQCGMCGRYLLDGYEGPEDEDTGEGDEDDSVVDLPLAGQVTLFDNDGRGI